MIDLERSLGELAERLEVPNGEWIVSDVVRRIGEPPRRPAFGRVPRLTGAVVALVVVAIVALPGPRHAVARWLGFDSVRIEPGVTVPSTKTGSTKTSVAPTVSVGSVVEPTTLPVPDLGLGPPQSIERAKSVTGLPDPTPALLGDPQSIHVVQPPATGQIVLVYPPSALVPESPVIGAGALVSVIPAHIEEGFFEKTLGTTSTVRSASVDGNSGYWIEGSPHQLMFVFGDQIQPDTLRLATNTLLWQRGEYVYRIEADVDFETAIRIAQSIP
jgi:hypothetical protein